MSGRRLLQLLMMALSLCILSSQSNAAEDPVDSVAKASEFAVPTSPAFVLLGVTPSKVARPGFARDLNLELITKDDKIISDAAIDVQPVWLLGFANTSAASYRNKSGFARTISTLGISLATAEKDSTKSLSWAARLTPFRGWDPLTDETYSSRIRAALDYSPKDRYLTIREAELEGDSSFIARRSPVDTTGMANVKIELAEVRDLLKIIDASTAKRLQAIDDSCRNRHWNDTRVEIGFGQLFNYTSAQLDSVRFRSQGVGAWVTAGLGLGSRWYLSGQFKYDDSDRIPRRDWGANIRYANANGGVFVEYIRVHSSDIHSNELAYGGELRLSTQLFLEAGVRGTLDEDMNLHQWLPLVRVRFGNTLKTFKL